MGKIFAVTSGKGGVGKSTFSVGTALSLSRMDYSVLLIDMDSGLRCLDLMLGVSDKLVFDIADVLNGTDLSDAVLSVEKANGLHLLAAAYDGGVDANLFGEFIANTVNLYDFIIIDFPAGIELDAYKALPQDTLFITVCTPDAVSIRDASFVANKISCFSSNRRIVINKFNLKAVKKGKSAGIDEIIDSASTRLLGLVPFDENPLRSLMGRGAARSKMSKAFTRIARRICGENIPLFKLTKI